MVGMIDPFPGHYDASDPFGNSAPPRTYPHTGSDWNGISAGTDIPATSSGTVAFSGWEPTGGNGNCLCVDMGDGMYWAYLHMQSDPGFTVGDSISQGQIVGQLGDTGSNASGAHLHITISDSSGAYQGLGNKVDPYEYIYANLGPGGAPGNLYVDVAGAYGPAGRLYRIE